MTLIKIVPGSERVGSPVRGPAAPGRRDRPGAVIRRSDRHPARNTRRRIACIVGAIDFGFVGFTLAWVATIVVLLHIAIGRAR